MPSKTESIAQLAAYHAHQISANSGVNANLKMSVFAEKECYFSPDSIQVYTALTTTLLVGLKPVKP